MSSLNRAALHAAIGAITCTRPAHRWIERLNAAGVPCGPIYRVDQTFADPQVEALGIAQPIAHPKLGEIKLVGQPVTLSRTPSQLAAPAPEAGEHSDAILREVGLSAETIAGLRTRGIV